MPWHVNCRNVLKISSWVHAFREVSFTSLACSLEFNFSYIDKATMIRGVKGPWDPGGVKHTFKNFFSSAWGQADFQGRRNVMTQATCGNVVGLCLGSSSEWASLWIRGSQQYIKTGHDRERHRTDSGFLLKTAFPLSLCCSWFLTLVHAILCLISPILLQNCTQITYCTLAIVIWRWSFITST